MKKVYIAPTTAAYKIETRANLLGVSGTDGVNSVSVSNESFSGTKDNVLGRGGFFDDSED